MKATGAKGQQGPLFGIHRFGIHLSSDAASPPIAAVPCTSGQKSSLSDWLAQKGRVTHPAACAPVTAAPFCTTPHTLAVCAQKEKKYKSILPPHFSLSLFSLFFPFLTHYFSMRCSQTPPPVASKSFAYSITPIKVSPLSLITSQDEGELPSLSSS